MSHQQSVIAARRRNNIFGDNDPVVSAFLQKGGDGAIYNPNTSAATIIGRSRSTLYAIQVNHTATINPTDDELRELRDIALSIAASPVMAFVHDKIIRFYDVSARPVKIKSFQ
jgi:hypothetical protein